MRHCQRAGVNAVGMHDGPGFRKVFVYFQMQRQFRRRAQWNGIVSGVITRVLRLIPVITVNLLDVPFQVSHDDISGGELLIIPA